MTGNKGIKPIGQQDRNLGGMDFFLLWAGAAVSLAEIWAGGLLIPLGFAAGFLVILLGHLIGNTPMALGGIIGSKTGLPTMVAVRPSFGIRGSYFATVLNLIQLVGWTGVMLWIGGQAAQTVWPMPSFGFRGWVLVAGISTTLWAVLGRRYWKWLQRIAVTALIALCCIMTYVVLHEYGLGRLMEAPSKGGMPFMVALDLVIAMPISWLPLVCDYSRYGKRTGIRLLGNLGGLFHLQFLDVRHRPGSGLGHPIPHAGEHGAGTDDGSGSCRARHDHCPFFHFNHHVSRYLFHGGFGPQHLAPDG